MLAPLVEDLAPVPIPVGIEHREVAVDQVAFAKHVVRVVARWVERSLPRQASRARSHAVEADSPTNRERTQWFSLAPSWLSARIELGYELQQVVAEPAPTGREIFAQARQILDLISGYDLRPVLVLDDTDKWLNTAWHPDAETVRVGFFGNVIRVLAEDLASAAAVAVHTSYLDDPAYRAAGGFLDTTITVPALPGPDAVRQVLDRRIALVLGQDADADPHTGGQTLSDEAVVELFDHYTRGPTSDLRRRLLYVAHTALTRAVDAAADRVLREHLEVAIAECADA